ncbi:MAG TPA: hypothetical protein VFC19_51765 [Candidatus Limnocylindrales bacterium]|nr:hypothetical protein [Candidatus Limnocylindrales bacterium]
MAGKDLTAAEKAFLILLMAENREVYNTELTERYGISLTGTARETLKDQKLVTSRKVGRGYAHELTDQGWAQCKEELTAAYVKGTGPGFPALHALLGALHRYLAGSGQTLADLFVPSERPPKPEKPAPAKRTPAKRTTKPKPDLATRVVEAYHRAAPRPNAWVKLADVRAALRSSKAKKADITDALLKLALARQIILIPEENQKTLTRRDHDAAVPVGGEPNHLMRIEA